ncbi:type I polyketide synthase [Streptomyces noursei]|uniref:type I polyketide synthase n=1 Tax=Streptomyces noursei TaxID=1971 RepID=UPI00167294B3|nr:type I polyketide synthase [Streptomyces noursei]MCZ1021158.1 type I polyketide synthase [Streptomyces noursei]GGX54020.1 type I polyketide synthase [Streptomyces noursei]
MQQEQSGPVGEPVAVVGVACRLPGGVRGLDDLASLLAAGRDAVTSVPPDRFVAAEFLDGGRPRPGRTYTVAGGFLDDVTGFDCGYFSWISPREASRMDPQQRLLLELAVEALDDAGLDGERLAGTDGAVFIGCSSKDYGALQATSPDTGNAYSMSGTAGGNTANRISHLLDWHGQSMAVDTACSSALTAVHQACEHLRAGRSGLALAGGINVLLDPYVYNGFSDASMLSPTGRCRAFSESADGYVRAEGGGLLLLKPLSVALAEHDRVHAVIVASGSNNDGRTAGLALPNGDAQRALLEEVYRAGGISPDRLVYLEAHGTGTAVGDPIECAAIGEALARARTVGPLPIGSVKTNIGHMEAGSGVAGLLKALLTLRDRTVPATLHALPLNSAIDFAGIGLKPAVEAEPVEVTDRSVVGVNSFGFGGANAHVVLAPPTAPAPEDEGGGGTPARPVPVVVSARTPEALGEAGARMAERLEACDAREFYDIAHTSARRRTRHPHRTVVLASTPAEAAQALRGAARGERPAPGLATAQAVHDGKVAFAFAGNGSQWAGMGADLLAAEPVFREAVGEVDAALRRHLDWSVVDEMTAGPENSRIHATEVAQPLLFAFQAGLVELLAAHGIRPTAVTGHSVGEIAAAYTAGALSLEEAATVVACRSRAQALTVGQGTMAAVGLSEEDTLKELVRYGGRLELAGINSHTDTTVAGNTAALDELGEELTARGVFFRPLDLDYAFHSQAMDAIEAPLRASLAQLCSRPPRLPFASTVTGALLKEGQQLDAAYWWHNVRRPVLFGPATDTLLDLGADVLLDVGPHAVLRPYLQRLGLRRRDRAVAVVRTCTRRGDSPGAVRTAVAHALAAGAAHDAQVLFPRQGRVVDLPAYPWQRERHWNGAPDWWGRVASDGVVDRPLLGQRAAVAEPTWHGNLSSARTPWLDDHRVGTTTVLPGTAYLEAAFEAGREALDTGVLEMTDLLITTACVLPGEDSTDELLLQTSLEPQTGTVTIASRTGRTGGWQRHARGRVRRLRRNAPDRVDLAALMARTESRPGAATTHYAALSRAGVRHGPAFQVLTDLRAGSGEVLSAYRLQADTAGYLAHPALLDGALQTGAPLLAAPDGGHLFLPAGIEGARLWRRPAKSGFVHATARTIGEREAVWDLRVLDEDGEVSLELTGCRLRRFDHEGDWPLTHHEIALRAAPVPAEPATPVRLPAPAELLAATREERHRLTAAVDDRYPRFAELDWRALGHYATRAFVELLPGRQEFGTDDLHAAGVRPQYRPMVALLARAACDSGTLASCAAPDGGSARWRFTDMRPDPEEQVRIQLQELPDWAAASTVFNRCRPHLAAVLSGAADPREMLFADADQHLMSQLYADSPQLRLQNLYARGLVREIVGHWPEGRPLRVLEVGVGTGGLTGAILPELPADRTRYTFTDVSSVFFARAEARFRDRDFVEYRTLDLDRDLSDQGFADDRFDLVLAGNVLHATTDVHRAAERVAGLLADGGLLLALESLEADLVGSLFGLLDEYWTCDDDRDGGPPLLSREEWTRCLTAAGFTEVAHTGVAPDPLRQDATVLLARRAARPAAPVSPPPPQAAGTWAVIADPATRQLGEAVAARLAAPLADLLDAAPLPSMDPGAPPRVVVLLNAGEAAAPDRVEELTVTRAEALRRLTEELAAAQGELCLVTPPTGSFPAPERPLSPADAPMWGLGRVLATEYPAVRIRRISLEPVGELARDADRLVGELLTDEGAPETVMTSQGRFQPRLVTSDMTSRRGVPGSGYRLRLSDPGLAHRLVWVPESRREPGGGELLIEVKAAALNYRDVMVATGLVPDEYAPAEGGPRLGLECSGVVTATGPGVTGFAPGDRVYASGYGCLASHVVVSADQTGHMPDAMRFSEAATLPAVFLTVQYALEETARLRPGEAVLVHGGAGGIGLAALQYAHDLGAEVIATAGTPAKRDLLRGLGIRHVFDSRDLSFAEEVGTATAGRGVDVVLNSLAGEAIARGLECLRPGGRFVELGKRDLYANTPLLLGPFRNNIAYFGVDVGSLAAHAPAMAASQFAELVRRVTDGRYRPLPHQVYAADRIAEAFQTLLHSKHIGKVVIDLAETPPVADPGDGLRVDPGAGYLITGGFSGLGAAFAEYLAQAGARHLVLVGRRGAATPEGAGLLERLTARGVQVRAHAADITDPDAVAHILDEAQDGGHPVRGVVHAAMHIDDAPLRELTPERFASVLRPKVAGTLVLDRATRERELDFFVVCSSTSALLGNRHQGPYCAANVFGEALVRERRRAGLPGLAVEWGNIRGTGYVERAGLLETLARSGVGGIDPGEAWHALHAHAAGQAETTVIGRFDWHRLGRFFPTLNTWLLQGDDTGTTAGTESVEDVRARLEALPPEDAADAIAEVLVELAAKVLQTAVERVDRTCPLDRLGLDSLMIVELSVLVRRRLGCDISVLELASVGCLDDLARRVLPLVRGDR